MRADEVKTSAGRGRRRPEENRRGAPRHARLRKEPSTAGRPGPARRFAGPPSAAVRIFFCTVAFGQRHQRGGLLGVLPGAGGRCRRFRPPPALPRRLPRDAERMRASPGVLRLCGLRRDASRVGPGLIGIGFGVTCAWARSHRHRMPVSGIGFGALDSDAAFSMSASGRAFLASDTAFLSACFLLRGVAFLMRTRLVRSGRGAVESGHRSRHQVPRSRNPGRRSRLRTQAGPPVGRAWGAVRAAAFFRARTGGVVASRSVFWKISASWKAATG